MTEKKNIIQAAQSSMDMFNGTKNKFDTWMEFIKNAAQISGQNVICIALSKLTGSLLSTANRLKTRSPNLMWMEHKKELSMQYSVTLSDSHATQALNLLE